MSCQRVLKYRCLIMGVGMMTYEIDPETGAVLEDKQDSGPKMLPLLFAGILVGVVVLLSVILLSDFLNSPRI